MTEDDYNSWRFRKDDVHFNGGKEWFGYGHRCIDQPRLLVVDKYLRKDRSVKRSYQVDGKIRCETLAEALAALSVPPVVNEEERALLATVLPDWYRPDERGNLVSLAYMGLVEWGRDEDKKVTCRLSEAGRKVLAEVTP